MPDTARTIDLAAVAEEAYLFTLPLVAMETFRRRRMMLGPMHDMLHARKLLHHKSRAITAPNNDTLYSNCWLDLNEGPATITLPETGDRYVSLAVMDMWTDNFAVLGTRTTGPDGGSFTLIGPDASAKGIEGPVMRSSTPTVFALARIIVEGPEDLEAAHAVQDGIILTAPPPPNAPNGDPAADTRLAGWREYFSHAARLMQVNRPRAADLGTLRRIAPLGLMEGFDPSRFTAAQGDEITAGMKAARARLGRGLSDMSGGGDGWLPPPARLGRFGEDYISRARVAVGGLAALPLEEATYYAATSFHGQPLHGNKPLRWTIPADAPIPVDAFWSLSMYEPTPDGELFFTENPIARYAIGDRTPGLQRNPDGSLDIWIGHADPGGARSRNWLPAPDGPYQLILRAYLPRPALLEGRYAVPVPVAV